MIPTPPNLNDDNVEPGSEAINIHPQPPFSDGGSPIIDYEIWHYTNGVTGFIYVGLLPAAELGNGFLDTLTTVGQTVSVMSRCRNADGYSPFSPIVTVISQGPLTGDEPPAPHIVLDFITPIRERMLLLLERFDPTRRIFRIGNTSRRDDKTRYGLNAKPDPGAVSDFPRVEIVVGRATETGRKCEVFYDEQNDSAGDQPIDILQTFIITIVHEAFNEPANALIDIQLAIAIRRGGLHLRDPDMVGSELPFVFGWNDIGYERSRETVNASARGVTRISIPVRVKLLFSEAA